jgi:endonuclease YncB( thermonuclease family)
MKRAVPVVLVAALLLLAARTVQCSEPDTLRGRVVTVLDGDTLDVLVDQRPVRVRLWGIDAPEKDQAFGQKSKESLSTCAFGRPVAVTVRGKDRYDRALGTVFAGAIDCNRRQVHAGMAWWYQKYAPQAADLAADEARARNARVGLWVDPAPVPPWAFRAAKRGPR